MIIGITGFNSSGKDTAAEHLKKKGFTSFSLSDMIRDEATKRGISQDRANLQKLGNELREKFGAGVLAKMAVQRVHGKNTDFVITSIRNPSEVEELRKLKEFVLFGVDCPIETRYERARNRARDKDVISFEKFKESEQLENSSLETGQQLDKVMKMSDRRIANDSTVEIFHKRIDDALLERNKTKSRVDWDTYFMNIAREVATRGTCDRKFVGAVIVRDKVILSTGYNGSIRGMPHCSEDGHMMEEGHCVATVHAEANAIVQAARNGVNISSASIYTTASPCWYCFKLIANAGIGKVYFGEFYRDDKIFSAAKRIGIELIDMSK